MSTIGQPHRCRDPGDFFHHNRVAQIAQIAAAVFLGHGHAQQTQFAELWPHIHGELVVAVDLSGSRCEFLLTELVDRIPEHIQLFTQSVVERGVGGIHSGTPVPGVRRG